MMTETNPQAEASTISGHSSGTVTRLAAVPVSPRSPASPPPAQAQADLFSLQASVDQARAVIQLAAKEQARITQQSQHLGRILAVLGAIERVLSVRAYLLAALAGSFVIGLLAVQTPTWIALAILIAFTALTVTPLCILDYRLHQRPQTPEG